MFAPKGCVTRWPNVAPRSQQKHKQSVEKNLQRVKKTTFTSGSVTPASPCTTPTGSGRGGHPGHAWQADQPWESILDEKSGIKVLYFNHLLHFLHSAVCPLSTDPKDSRINHTRLSLYNAERIRPRTGHGTGPPPIEAGKRPLVQGFVNKNSVKTPYPMEVVRLLEYHQSKMPLLSGILKNLMN